MMSSETKKAYPPILTLDHLEEILQENRRTITKKVKQGVYPAPIRRKSDRAALRWKIGAWENFLGIDLTGKEKDSAPDLVEMLRQMIREEVRRQLREMEILK